MFTAPDVNGIIAALEQNLEHGWITQWWQFPSRMWTQTCRGCTQMYRGFAAPWQGASNWWTQTWRGGAQRFNGFTVSAWQAPSRMWTQVSHGGAQMYHKGTQAYQGFVGRIPSFGKSPVSGGQSHGSGGNAPAGGGQSHGSGGNAPAGGGQSHGSGGNPSSGDKH